jgi:hypothetical protein
MFSGPATCAQVRTTFWGRLAVICDAGGWSWPSGERRINEKVSYPNQRRARAVSRDASLPLHSATSRDLRRTIPLTALVTLQFE